MDLTIGRQYKKSDFGITGNAVKQWSEITAGGELFTFFSEGSQYNNIVEEDGFVYEGRGEYAVIPDGVQRDLHRHVFVKKKPGSYIPTAEKAGTRSGIPPRRTRSFGSQCQSAVVGGVCAKHWPRFLFVFNFFISFLFPINFLGSKPINFGRQGRRPLQ